jgi:hypothetical protein
MRPGSPRCRARTISDDHPSDFVVAPDAGITQALSISIGWPCTSRGSMDCNRLGSSRIIAWLISLHPEWPVAPDDLHVPTDRARPHPLSQARDLRGLGEPHMRRPSLSDGCHLGPEITFAALGRSSAVHTCYTCRSPIDCAMGAGRRCGRGLHQPARGDGVASAASPQRKGPRGIAALSSSR